MKPPVDVQASPSSFRCASQSEGLGHSGIRGQGGGMARSLGRRRAVPVIRGQSSPSHHRRAHPRNRQQRGQFSRQPSDHSLRHPSPTFHWLGATDQTLPCLVSVPPQKKLLFRFLLEFLARRKQGLFCRCGRNCWTPGDTVRRARECQLRWTPLSSVRQGGFQDSAPTVRGRVCGLPSAPWP